MHNELYEKLLTLSLCKNLCQHDYIFNLADKTASLLENEKQSFRPKSKNGKSGGLLDFSNLQKKPLIVVPDLHARTYFLWHLLNWNLPQSIFSNDAISSESNEKMQITVFEALQNNLIRIVLVGDLLHSEARGKLRWMNAWDEFMHRIENGPAMTEEMKESLSLLSMVMELKCAFPENFHILKGNHENINNSYGHGNFPFCKFANEGEMVRLFMQTVYGDDVLFVIQCFERALPILAFFPECLVSHAEPKRAFSIDEVINYSENDEVISGLTWTENGSSANGSVETMIKSFYGTSDPKEIIKKVYIGGHRPVHKKYFLRQNGLFVQIHNPEQENIALVMPNRIFNPKNDIHSVSE